MMNRRSWNCWVKPVVTLDEGALAGAMFDLWSRLPKTSIAPDGIVGIATGGLVCARILAEQVKLPLFECALRRPSTAVKSLPLNRRALRALPYSVSDWLRRFEDWSLERKTSATLNRPAVISKRDVNEVLSVGIAGISEQVRTTGLRHLLVIDDAVDSGDTLGTVVMALRAALSSDTFVTSAVITQTRSTPAFIPDVALYHNTLCRFSWSFDFHGVKKGPRD